MAVPEETAYHRIRARTDTDASEADAAVLETQLASFAPLATEEQDLTLRTDGSHDDMARLLNCI